MSVMALSLTPLIVLLCLLVTMRSSASSTPDAGCTWDNVCVFGPKGEQGFAGHPGSPGRRGEKGFKGDSGAPGTAGNKGEKGSPGASGTMGKQGIQGVVGPPGKACRGLPGSQGPPGNTGVLGPPGPAGVKGVKGRKGVNGHAGVKGDVGPRGFSARDGIPGPPGHPGFTGQTGSKGPQGDRGLPGHKGEQGPQGPVGAEMSEATMRKFIDPVKEEMKQLKMKLQTITEQLTTCCNNEPDVVACHLYGNTGGRTLSGGTLVTTWTSSFGVLTGGMTYSNGYITVPVDGLYYVYAQLWSDPKAGQTYCGFYIFQNGKGIGRVYTQNRNPSSEDFSKYGGIISALNKGDRLFVKVVGTCYYYFGSPHAVFGCFRL